ncbi:MAG: peptidyl-prolyl cis-trans isomerase [Prevotella sp.]|nr:peptidyl-prolyl cis-trans isomerase [Prevotella sp.]MCM1075184.1 peptidyl-prolyl cis-trans isomerase [Ruminococcus sp.]
MNKKFLLAAALAAGVALTITAKKDPIVMKVADREVPLSEFEYLYHKNANQQLQPQTIDEYAEMFKLYKLKVADALAAGIDTTEAFKNEYNGYMAELRFPYCSDSTYVDQLMHEAYDRMMTEVEAKHIMIMKPRGLEAPQDLYSRADSLLTALRNGADFEQLAKQYSDDKPSAEKGGSMGWITALRTPYEFETAVYNTPEGEYSDIVETDFGYHIIKGGAKRPAHGDVLVEHILIKSAKTDSLDKQQKAKALADSLYNVLQDPSANFEELAVKYSEDPGSARQGGKLPWFGIGRMIPVFEEKAFAMNKGEVSEPVLSDFGYHIIKKLDTRGIPAYEDIKPTLSQAMNNRSDTRGRWKARDFAERLRKKYNFKYDKKVREQMMDFVAQHGMTQEFNDHFQSIADKPYMSIADKKYTVADFLEHMSHFRNVSFPSTGKRDLAKRMENFEQQELYGCYFDRLPIENTAFRNLTNEYRDGMLLFEISNRKVWDKAAKDTEGLKAFFEKNRADYKWTNTHVKGILVQAENDSAANVARAMLDTLSMEEAVPALRKELGSKIKADRILMAKGDNDLVDACVFDMKEYANPNTRYPIYFVADMRLLEAPEEVADVLPLVTADYQNALEAAWIEELQAKYPVVIYEKELKKVK